MQRCSLSQPLRSRIVRPWLREFSELILGSYPRINESDYRVLLTLESRDPAYLKRAMETLVSRLPADAIHKIE